MKRQTVIRMLKKRLAESQQLINISNQFEEMVNVMGGDNSKEHTHRKNMQTDIDQLKYLIWCLKNRDAIKEMFGEFGA